MLPELISILNLLEGGSANSSIGHRDIMLDATSTAMSSASPPKHPFRAPPRPPLRAWPAQPTSP